MPKKPLYDSYSTIYKPCIEINNNTFASIKINLLFFGLYNLESNRKKQNRMESIDYHIWLAENYNQDTFNEELINTLSPPILEGISRNESKKITTSLSKLDKRISGISNKLEQGNLTSHETKILKMSQHIHKLERTLLRHIKSQNDLNRLLKWRPFSI